MSIFDEDDVSALDGLLGSPAESAGQRRRVARAIAQAGKGMDPPARFGQRVKLAPSLGYMLSARRLPDPQARGSIVCVKTARGEVSAMGRQGFFTAWTDGKFLELPPDILRALRGADYDPALARRVANLEEVVGQEYALSASSPQELIHKATRDLWAYQKIDGEFRLCRLFSYDGNPLHA